MFSIKLQQALKISLQNCGPRTLLMKSITYVPFMQKIVILIIVGSCDHILQQLLCQAVKIQFIFGLI
jgi:hypothetical protein